MSGSLQVAMLSFGTRDPESPGCGAEQRPCMVLSLRLENRCCKRRQLSVITALPAWSFLP